jgi:hypothetical protein
MAVNFAYEISISYPQGFLSSSSALQPYVNHGLLQKLLPAKVSGYCFFRFHDENLFQDGVVSPTSNPSYPGGPMFSVRVVSLS